MKNPFKKVKKMVIVITKDGGMTKREVIGDNLEKEERSFVMNEVNRIIRI